MLLKVYKARKGKNLAILIGDVIKNFRTTGQSNVAQETITMRRSNVGSDKDVPFSLHHVSSSVKRVAVNLVSEP
ncbi:hypothetical protein PoB_005269100 [Plakobranchus ocellatus]|uniref:Uncharacterized protein n=1 Tax=Plakobranchus ocellatus TaxID=259542 RepID=A0AAV4BSH2_9GAST|nr:hypothetical protein PoB_005269100 [Plakobranchus ocellatus]